MTTVNTVEDIIAALDADPELLQAVRSRILTRELLELPEVVARLAESHNRLEATVARLAETLREFMEATNRRLDALEEGQKRLEEGQNRMADDIGRIKGFLVRQVIGRRAISLARRMGFKLKAVLSIEDVVDIVDGADTSGISSDDLFSFEEADMILKVADPEGVERYVPIEVSYTVHTSDVRRAVRNADFLTRLTGLPAHPAVAGIRAHDQARRLIDADGVYFFRAPESMLRPD